MHHCKFVAIFADRKSVQEAGNRCGRPAEGHAAGWAEAMSEIVKRMRELGTPTDITVPATGLAPEETARL
ncbi:hypothetical protein J4864_09570 [Prevotella multiformis]|uniref:hypothetical protein n=1 Tax=Prevotella multiformis TaxID=282402 RepID=UPI001BAAADBC|nr:hypothetical protein [Prevotella multiformis]QUB72315.1 hypothetical protein J4864_09570 [Prevotella multiformis]